MKEFLTKLESPEHRPLEPQGWFRWLYNHFLGRYPGSDERLLAELGGAGWHKLEQNFSEIWPREEERIVRLIENHAWKAGMLGFVKIAEACWPRLSPVGRGAFLAGFSEPWRGEVPYAWIEEHLEESAFSPDSVCQLTCNALRAGREKVIEKVLASDVDWTASIHRGDPYIYPKTAWSEEVDILSNRLIDLILEAALIVKNMNAVCRVLAQGANPDATIWQLERSYNEQHTPLTYAISEDQVDIAFALLEAGASPTGSDFVQPGLPLFLALYHEYHDLARELLRRGASFNAPPGFERPRLPKSKRTKYPGLSSRDFLFGYDEEDMAWAHRAIDPIAPLADISTKPFFHMGNAQGGQLYTFTAKLLMEDDLEHLREYEAAGLDIRLTPEELHIAIYWGDAMRCLRYLLGKQGPTVLKQAWSRIRRHKPDFGAFRREIETRPQANGINLARDFDPQGQVPLRLPDGTALYADFDAIAPPGHAHGPCLEGRFWLREMEAVWRRREDAVIITRLAARWIMAKRPEYTRQVKSLLPCIREVDGQFIYLGVTVGDLSSRVRARDIQRLLYDWHDKESFKAIEEEALRRIREQDAANSRPRKPVLSKEELDGYPVEFWPYLVRLENGYIGMTEVSARERPDLLPRYEDWSRANKREDSFIPDPRLLQWSEWERLPKEFQPFFHIDPTFDRPGVISSGAAANDYERAMIHKAVAWWNAWMSPQIMRAIEEWNEGKASG